MKKLLRFVALDFDGVIVDSMGLQEKAWRDAAREVTRDVKIEQTLVANLYSGYAGSRMFDGLDLSPHILKQLRITKNQLWLRARDSAPIFPDAREVLRELHPFLAFGIGTTAPRCYVDSVLRRAGLLGLIAAIVTNDDAPRPKPEAAFLHELFTRAHYCREESVMVGDTRTDLHLAANAGVSFIGFGSQLSTDIGISCVSNWRSLGVELRRRAEEA